MKSRKTAPVIEAPQDMDELSDWIALIGDAQRARETLQTLMDAQLARVRERYERAARPHAEEIERLSAGVQVYCEANRASLTREGRVKTVKLGSGEVSWRIRPPSVALRKVADIIAALKAVKLTQFIRTKEEIDKDAILRDPEAVADIPGIAIKQGEDFVIKPFETRLEEVRK